MTRAGLLLATICSVAASAAEVHWSELPKVLKGKTIVVEMNQGGTREGRFVSSHPDSIVLENLKIPRDQIMSIYSKGRESRFTHLKNMGAFVLMGYFLPFSDIGGGAWPLTALISIPIATVGGAVAAPISFVWDLFDLAKSPSEYIVVLPDPTAGVSQ